MNQSDSAQGSVSTDFLGYAPKDNCNSQASTPFHNNESDFADFDYDHKMNLQKGSVNLSSPPIFLQRDVANPKMLQPSSLADELKNVLHELEDPLDVEDSGYQGLPEPSFHAASKQTSTPTHTPVKNLPFSPSQFLNSPSNMSSSNMTSTPLPNSSSGNNSLTTDHGNLTRHLSPSPKEIPMSLSPHTPTPFKHAMAEVARQAKSHCWSPRELEDFGAVLKDCDPGYEADMSSSILSASLPRHSKRKPNKEHIQHNRKVRQSLEEKLIRERLSSNDSALHSPETPSKSLVGDNSLLLSPPSIIKDTLSEEVLEEVFSMPNYSKSTFGSRHCGFAHTQREASEKIGQENYVYRFAPQANCKD